MSLDFLVFCNAKRFEHMYRESVLQRRDSHTCRSAITVILDVLVV
jgi:hypothetical protein